MTEMIIKELAPIVTSIVVALVAWGLAELSRLIRQRTKNEKISSAFDHISSAVMTSVMDLEQTARKVLRDGKLSQAEARKLKTMAIKNVKNRLPPAVLDVVKRELKDLDDWIGAEVEAALYEINSSKRNKEGP